MVKDRELWEPRGRLLKAGTGGHLPKEVACEQPPKESGNSSAKEIGEEHSGLEIACMEEGPL